LDLADETQTDSAWEDDGEPPRMGPAPSGDIAEAIRRLAERTRGAVSPTPEMSLPPGATVVPSESATGPARATETSHAKSSNEIEQARRAVAERVARILDRAQMEITAHDEQPASQAGRASVGKAEASESGAASTRPSSRPRRPVIDDTEVFDPGRDPAELFAEAERQEKIVNGNARRIGPISGRWIALAPWIAVLVLSVLGLVIGAVDAFKQGVTPVGAGPRAAATVLAVFGVMLLMSVYFIFWNRASDDA
jgi:hypothetical protein